jgi:hypothetical protein
LVKAEGAQTTPTASPTPTPTTTVTTTARPEVNVSAVPANLIGETVTVSTKVQRVIAPNVFIVYDKESFGIFAKSLYKLESKSVSIKIL